MRFSPFLIPLFSALCVCSALPSVAWCAETPPTQAASPVASNAAEQSLAQSPGAPQLSLGAFRDLYNAAAAQLGAPAMPEQAAESVDIPEKADKQKIRTSVRVYFLNERTSLLVNTPADKPDTLVGAAVIGGGGEDYTLASAEDIHTAMLALISALTPSLDEVARQGLASALGLKGGEDGDFTDGKVRSQTLGNLLFYTAASENDGIELVVRFEKK